MVCARFTHQTSAEVHREKSAPQMAKLAAEARNALSTSLSVVAEAWKVPGYELY